MIKEIDGLKMPPYMDATPELVNRDAVNQTVSGRLVVELDPNPKWEIPIEYSTENLSVSFQASFYGKCFAMRTTPADITFISPYDGSSTTVTALCTEITAPEPGMIAKSTRKPLFYKGARAVFREV